MKRIVLIIISCIISLSTYAISFDIYVANNYINQNEPLEINFVLEGARIKKEPNFSLLNKSFKIVTQYKSNNFSYINGAASSATKWTFVVLAKQSGNVVIPAIDAKTNVGVLSTKPVNLTVDNAIVSNNALHDDVKIVADINANTVYANQALLYSLNLYTKIKLLNFNLEDLDLEKFIIEKQLERKEHVRVINGERVKIYNINYIITPLYAGDFTIKPLRAQYETIGDIFGNGYGIYTTATNELQFKVEPTIDNLPPFSKLNLIEEYDNTKDTIQDDESITRKITLIGDDGFVDLLDNIIIDDANLYKVYADKPSVATEVTDKGVVRTKKVYSFTFVPTGTGAVTLPEVKLKWFNINSKKVEVSTLAAKTLMFNAGQNTSAATNTVGNSNPATTNMDVNQSSNFSLNPNSNPINIYLMFGIIGSVMLNVALITIHFWRNKSGQTDKLAKLGDVNKISDIAELKEFIYHYAKIKWQLKHQTTIESMLLALKHKGYEFNQHAANELKNIINNNLYYKDNNKVTEAINAWLTFQKTVIKHNKKKTPAHQNYQTNVSKLNPT